MSVLDKDKIDVIGTDNLSNEVILTISDHLEWKDEQMHLQALQDKLNTYIDFIEGRQIFDDYPNSIGKKLVIEIVGKYKLNAEGINFLKKVKPILQSIGIEIRQRAIG